MWNQGGAAGASLKDHEEADMPRILRRWAWAAAPLSLALGTVAMAEKPSPDLVCEIRSSPAGSGIRLEAVVSAGADMSGEYDFVITKRGGGGSSNVSQGGDFQTGPGEETVLGVVTLGPGEGSSVTAVLTVTEADGRASCEHHYPDPT